MGAWYYFGCLVDPAGHVKLRQYNVRYDPQGGWRAETWSKGITGKLWYVRLLQAADGGCRFTNFEAALAAARQAMEDWAWGYTTIDEGEPPRADYTQEAAREPAGMADPNWWAIVLGVDPDADQLMIRSAFRERAKATHPDTTGGNGDEFKRVYAAWEYIKVQKGW